MTNMLIIATNAAAMWFYPITDNVTWKFDHPNVVWDTPAVTVQVVTNVTHGNNEVRAPHQFSHVIGEPAPGSVTKEATEKTETVTITEIKILRFRWNGKPVEVAQEQVLSRHVKRWRRRDTWIKD